MKIKYCFLVLTISLFATSAKAEVTIWNWAYVIEGADEFLSGNGSSIFQIDGGDHSAPLYPSDNELLRLKLSFKGSDVSATLSQEKPSGEAIQLTGSVSFVPNQGQKDCTEVVKLSNGVNYMVLQRLSKSCKP